MSPRIAVAGVLALSLAVSACGESESDKFAERANKVCEDNNKRLRAAKDDVRKVLRIGRETAAELDGLEAPEDIRADYDRFVKLQVGYWKELTAASEARDQERVAAVNEHTGDEIAEKLGIDSCKG